MKSSVQKSAWITVAILVTAFVVSFAAPAANYMRSNFSDVVDNLETHADDALGDSNEDYGPNEDFGSDENVDSGEIDSILRHLLRQEWQSFLAFHPL